MELNIKSTWKFSDLASTLGAGILGFGLGVYFFQIVSSTEVYIILAGLVLHSIGMYFKHKLENQYFRTDAFQHTAPSIWINIIYWLCWLLLAGLLVYLWIKKQG